MTDDLVGIGLETLYAAEKLTMMLVLTLERLLSSDSNIPQDYRGSVIATYVIYTLDYPEATKKLLVTNLQH